MPPITVAADIHLDHADEPAVDRFLTGLAASSGESVLICGDISVARRVVTDLERIADAAQRPIHFVLGNHDHYGGSIAAVRDAVTDLATRRPNVQWLPPAGVVQLDPLTTLIGVDGWADGRFGNAHATPLRLNDDRLIAELERQPDRAHRLAVKRALADADAARLATLIERAASVSRTIVIATHIPPFTEALPTSGRLASRDWWPLLVCGATGIVIRDAAGRLPSHRFLVLAGHSHVGRNVTIGPNLSVVVAPARYGAPACQVVRTSD